MVDREEDLLWARYFEGLGLAENQVRDEKLDAAIRRGLEQGRTQRRIWHLRRGLTWTAGVAGTLAVCLLLLFMWPSGGMFDGSPSPSTTASQNENYPSYISSLMTSEMERATELGLYQPIGKSTEVAGTKVTVDGVLADGRTVVFFYTLENIHRKKLDTEVHLGLKDATGKTFDYLPVFLPTGTYPDDTVTHLKYTLNIEDPDAPTRLLLSVSTEESSDQPISEIPMEWSSQPYTGMKKTVPVNQIATIYGHPLTIDQIVMRPLSTTILFKPQESVDQWMSQSVKAKLYLGGEGEAEFQRYAPLRSLIYDYQTGSTDVYLMGLEFGSTYDKDWNEVTLEIDNFGVYPEKQRSISLWVDTDKEQLLYSEPSVKQVEVLEHDKTIEVLLHMNQTPGNKVSSPFTVDEYFNDNQFKSVYRILQDDRSPMYTLDGDNETIRFEIDKREYTQPLRITVMEKLDDSYKPQAIKIPLK
ncbi:DUF4179 domain-containing protein [Paenibacillus rubinfantis]|uniref:DUF4179 domain-containing protein n=1 Tax=Paenibacillus rubinfantis TaxID=1720296 RepID=UPI00073E1522|nr:DUF4179 domain-containing protein [Paenibacillus rubinfantis]